MNLKRIILLSLFLLFMVRLLGQHIEFSYDENGNRKTRTLFTEQLKSATIKFPVTDPKTLEPVDNAKKSITDETSMKSKTDGQEVITLVYPNPTKGFLKVEISNMPLSSTNEMRLYDLSGTEVLVKRNFDSYTEIDLSHLKDGVYILRIRINDKLFDWKVIKGRY